MNMKELIEATDRSDVQFLDSHGLLEHFEMDHDWVDLEKHGFKEHRIGGWRTDGYIVGKHLILLDDEPVCIVNLEKHVRTYEWLSQETFDTVFNKIRSITKPKLEPAFVDMSKEMGDGFEVYYGDDIIGDIVILKETNERWKVNKTFRGYKEISQWKDVVIEKDGVKKEVKTNEIIVPWFNK